MKTNMQPVFSHIEEHQAAFLQDLKAFLRIPSVASDPAHSTDVLLAADWVAARLRVAGLDEVSRLPAVGNPVIFARAEAARPAAPTLLIYGHYDVQSPKPLNQWHSDPFEPLEMDRYLIGRGTADMKSQLLAAIIAVEAYIRAETLPVNVIFLVEGEEELGSPSFGELLGREKVRLQADVALNLDAGMLGVDMPTITYTLRGAMSCLLTVRSAARDLHSGIYGGLIDNPIHIMARLLAGLHDADGRVCLAGFYDRVQPPDAFPTVHMTVDEETLQRHLGATALWGEAGYSAAERVGSRPTLDVLSIRGGEAKTAIPATATALISMRLVPDQDPNEIYTQLQDYFKQNVPGTADWQMQWQVGIPPFMCDCELSGVQAMKRALEAEFDVPVRFRRGGGTIPVVPMLKEELNLDSVLTGFSLPDDNMHGPDERIHLPTWRHGIRALVYFFDFLLQAGAGSNRK